MRSLVALCAFVMMGCAMQNNEADDAPILLSNEALERAITGTYLQVGGDSSGGHRIVEHFCSDGRWSVAGTRVPLFGRYTITDDVLSVTQDGGRRQDRRLYQTRNGEFRIQAANGSGDLLTAYISGDGGEC